ETHKPIRRWCEKNYDPLRANHNRKELTTETQSTRRNICFNSVTSVSLWLVPILPAFPRSRVEHIQAAAVSYQSHTLPHKIRRDPFPAESRSSMDAWDS